MTKETLFDTLNYERERIDILMRVVDELPEDIPYDGHINNWDKTLQFNVGSIEELTKCRAFLRSCFDGWHDKQEQVWNGYGDTMKASYNNSDGKPICIWLEFKRTNIPDGILKEGCHVVAEQVTEYHVVCDV